MKKSYLLFGLAMIITCSITYGQADSVLELSLTEAQDYAIQNYYLTVNAEMDIEAAKKKVMETTAVGLPHISGGADYSYIPEIPEAVFGGESYIYGNLNDDEVVTGADLNNPDRVGIGFIPGEPIQLGVEHNLTYNIMLTQLIFSGEYIVGLQASKTYKQFSEEMYENVAIELKELIANTYYTLLVLRSNEDLLQQTTDNLETIYTETKATANQGLMEQTDADQIKVNLKRTENSLKTVQRQIEFMEKMLKYQLGLTLSHKVVLTDELSDLIDRNLITGSQEYKFVLEDNIEYKLFDTQEKLNFLSLRQQQSKYLPSLSGFYKYEDKIEKAAIDFTMKHMVGISLTVPIFESGMKSAQVSQARIELEKAQLKKEQESQRLVMEAEQAKLDYLTALEQYENEKMNYELSSKILENTTEKYRLGVVSSMDLTLANNQYLEAQLSYSQTILELLTAKIKLDRAFNRL